MPITRAALCRLRLPLPRSSCGGSLARQLHATARRPNATGPTQIPTDLPAVEVYYDCFPITLHHYSWRGPRMALHASGKNEPLDAVERVMRSGSDVVREQEDGLVYPGPQGNDSVWNGALMLPLAPFLFDITDNMHDWYQEQKAAGRNVPEPYFLTVPKGFRMPNTLFLAQESSEMFYLFPRAPMPLSALNQELNKLFSSSGCSKIPYDKWREKYRFVDAFRKDWMAE